MVKIPDSSSGIQIIPFCGGLFHTLWDILQHPWLLPARSQQHLLPHLWQAKMSLDITKCPWAPKLPPDGSLILRFYFGYSFSYLNSSLALLGPLLVQKMRELDKKLIQTCRSHQSIIPVTETKGKRLMSEIIITSWTVEKQKRNNISRCEMYVEVTLQLFISKILLKPSQQTASRTHCPWGLLYYYIQWSWVVATETICSVGWKIFTIWFFTG